MTGADPVAALPMYDWPEVREATDRLWKALRDALRAEGLAAPETLERGGDPLVLWRHPRLALAQACGLPFVRCLAGRVTLLGAPDYRIEGAPPGHYRSAVVVRDDDPRDGLRAFRGARLAFNERGSQSGYAAIRHHVAPLACGGRFFASELETGAHDASAAAVAAGQADLAAIDWVSWRLFRRHRPEARGLRVLMSSDPTPALPLIAAAGTDAPRARAAIAAGLAELDPGSADALGIHGFRPFDPRDYDVIRDRWARAEAIFGPA